jgi:type I restriction enzyme S subunit
MSYECSLLDDVADVIDSLHKTPSYSIKGLSMVRCTDVKYGELDIASTLRVDEDVFKEFSRKYKPAEGDIIITRVGTYGITARVRGTNFCLGQNTAAIVPRKINSRYLYAALNSSFVWSQIEAAVVGSTQKTISLKVIKGLRIPRLGESTENEVATLIGSLDDRIALLRETNTTLEAIAQALFKSWFVDFDPVRAKQEGREPEGMDADTAALFPDSFEESALGLVPRGWKCGKLSTLANLNPETWSARNHPETIAYIDLANAKDNQISQVVDYHFSEAPSRARRVLRDGDTIVGTVRPGNRSFAFIKNPVTQLTGSTGFAVLRPRQPAYSELIYLLVTCDESIDYLTHVADGGAYPAVRPEVVINIDVPIAPDNVIEVFHSIVSPLMVRAAENQKMVETLATLRDTLLPRLISGQLRLPEAEAILKEAAA